MDPSRLESKLVEVKKEMNDDQKGWKGQGRMYVTYL